MKIATSARFREERQRFRFVFTCEECAHFDLESEVCGHGYPNAEHRLSRYERPLALAIVFCKEWEIA